MNISDYTGFNILNVLEREAEKWVFTLNFEQLHINYGDNVDWQRLENQILLCDETKEYLYKKPEGVRYVKGTRPVLENEVSSVCAGAKTDREKVLAILCFIRDLRKTHGTHIPEEMEFYGGSEEVLIEKGENLCECVSRLMVALCEIIGLPGRIIMHMIGHITCEIFLDGKWSFFDPRYGAFYVDENDKILSVAELMENREYILNQPDYVKDYISEITTVRKMQEKNYERHFGGKDFHLFEHYSLMDASKYNYGVKMYSAAERDGLFRINKVYRKYIEELLK